MAVKQKPKLLVTVVVVRRRQRTDRALVCRNSAGFMTVARAVDFNPDITKLSGLATLSYMWLIVAHPRSQNVEKLLKTHDSTGEISQTRSVRVRTVD